MPISSHQIKVNITILIFMAPGLILSLVADGGLIVVVITYKNYYFKVALVNQPFESPSVIKMVGSHTIGYS